MEKKEEFEQRPGWEVLNEQKERLLEVIKENTGFLDRQVLKPELIYPNMERYEIGSGMNNLMLSTVALKKRYADNTWVMADTVSNAKYIDEKDGTEKNVFLIKKGEKATKIGVEVNEIDRQDPVTGSWYKEKLDKPFTKNINVYNLSQFSFSKGIYPRKTSLENQRKDYIVLSPEKMEELKQNTFEAKLEKFFIEQKYNIKGREQLGEIDREELIKNIENSRTKDGNLHKDSFRMEYFPGKAIGSAGRTIENSKIEINKKESRTKKSEKKVSKKKKRKDKETER